MPTERIAVVDVETTGLSPWRHDRIVEIGIVVTTADGHIAVEYETLLNPERDLGPTSIHRISSSDVLQAPVFADVAGDVLDVLQQANIVAGHNVSFDKNFLVKEFERIGVSLPELPLLCTCQNFGRNSLAACCNELGIPFDGMPHRALSDALATVRLLVHLFGEDRSLLDRFRFEGISWPQVRALKTPCFCREQAGQLQSAPPRFLQRIAARMHHDVDADAPNVLAYLALVDRVLEDRTVDQSEESALVDAVTNLGLSSTQVDAAHKQYVHNLVVLALADGIISEQERYDLHHVSRLLGQDYSRLDALLESASTQLASATQSRAVAGNPSDLQGQRVCFTGELQATIGGKQVTRDIAESLASGAGLTVVTGVTMKLDLLVVADPQTQSGKAKKAREYGTRIVADMVFWRMIGVAVD